MIQYRRLTALCEDEEDAVEQNKEQKIGHLVEDLEIQELYFPELNDPRQLVMRVFDIKCDI